MTRLEMEKKILEKMVEDFSTLDADIMDLLLEENTVFDTPEKIDRWRANRKKFNTIKEDFDDFLLVRSGREPAFGSLG